MNLAAILAAWGPPFTEMNWKPVGGGFSGALVFKGGNQFALKAWPLNTSQKTIDLVHRYQTEVAAELPLIPDLIQPPSQNAVRNSYRYTHNRFWELSTWKPGEPLSESAPVNEVVLACEALAKLHRFWKRHARDAVGLPAEQRRTGLYLLFETSPLKNEDGDFVGKLIPKMERMLSTWRTRTVITHPCLCDVHREHILFTGRKVTGIIDFAATKFDHPAVDLARYLAEFPHAIPAGVATYHAAGGSTDVTVELVTLLAVSGDLGAAVWWHWKRTDDPSPTRQTELVQRRERILRRLRDWNANGFFDGGS